MIVPSFAMEYLFASVRAVAESEKQLTYLDCGLVNMVMQFEPPQI